MTRHKIPTNNYWCEKCQDYKLHYKDLGEMLKPRGRCSTCGKEKDE